ARTCNAAPSALQVSGKCELELPAANHSRAPAMWQASFHPCGQFVKVMRAAQRHRPSTTRMGTAVPVRQHTALDRLASIEDSPQATSKQSARIRIAAKSGPRGTRIF